MNSNSPTVFRLHAASFHHWISSGFSLLCSLSVVVLGHSETLAAGTEPPIITSGATFSHGAPPPSDAMVLFDGKDLSRWIGPEGRPPAWTIRDGYAEVRDGGITTKEEFGDIQLHIEWATPAVVIGKDQGRGNSGIYFQGRYEIQVLDSYENPTYFDGQAGAFYGNAAPLVNASKKPGEWQTYDIVFRAPKRGADGQLVPGSFTVFHNGVLVQDHTPIKGEATTAAPAQGIVPKGPLHLQDHGNPVRYRNIWLRKLN
ncbi:MAG: DUF1080 domain-containing protein [Verrucomicrobiales bacterium]|nr:DUF1080 domain-containing protein [Verrucomicrobiales bacterium]